MKSLAGFVVLAVAVTAVLVVVGAALLPARYGAEAISAVVWASGVSLFGSLVGALSLLAGRAPKPEREASAQTGGKTAPGPAGATRFLAAMLLRLGAVGLAALVVAWAGAVSLEPFLLWLAVSYLVLLVLDTAFALRVFRSL